MCVMIIDKWFTAIPFVSVNVSVITLFHYVPLRMTHGPQLCVSKIAMFNTSIGKIFRENMSVLLDVV